MRFGSVVVTKRVERKFWNPTACTIFSDKEGLMATDFNRQIENFGLDKASNGSEKSSAQKERQATENEWVSESNRRVKQSMARELIEMGLSSEAVERLLRVGEG
jgi:hypothetical protein